MNKTNKKQLEDNIAIGIIAAGIIGAGIRAGVKVYNHFTKSKRKKTWNSEYGNELKAKFIKVFHDKNHVKNDLDLCNKFTGEFEKALADRDVEMCEKIILELMNCEDEKLSEAVTESADDTAEKTVVPVHPSLVPKNLRDDYAQALKTNGRYFTKEELESIVKHYQDNENGEHQTLPGKTAEECLSMARELGIVKDDDTDDIVPEEPEHFTNIECDEKSDEDVCE